MKQQKTWLGVICVLASAIVWGSTGFVVRSLNDAGFGTFEALETECLIAAVFVGLYLLLFHQNQLKIRLQDLWCFAGAGILNIMLNSVCYFYAIRFASLSVIGSFVQLGPMFAIFFGCVLFKEKFNGQKAIAMILTFSGCVMVSGLFGGAEQAELKGIILGICSAVAYSMYSVFGRFAFKRGYDSITITFYSFVFAAFGTAFLADWPKMVSIVQADPSVWWWVLAMGIVIGFGGYILYTVGLANIENGKAGILSSMELVFSTLIGTFFYHEPMNLLIGSGVAFVVLGIAISSIEPKKKVSQ